MNCGPKPDKKIKSPNSRNITINYGLENALYESKKTSPRPS